MLTLIDHLRFYARISSLFRHSVDAVFHIRPPLFQNRIGVASYSLPWNSFKTGYSGMFWKQPITRSNFIQEYKCIILFTPCNSFISSLLNEAMISSYYLLKNHKILGLHKTKSKWKRHVSFYFEPVHWDNWEYVGNCRSKCLLVYEVIDISFFL